MNKSRSTLTSFASYAKTALVGATAAAGATITALGVKAIRMAADMEQTSISFEVMTGSLETTKKLMDDLRKMGASTPFEFSDLANSTKTLLSFGRTSEQVLRDLDMLSNVAAGDAQKLQSLSLVFGQIAANGRLTGGDLLQLINVGFNPLNEIAKRTGESMTELRDRMSKGKVGFEEVRQAFADATSEGGLFYKMNEKQSKTLLGQWSTLKDEFNTALMEMGKSLIENLDLKAVIASLSRMVEVFKTDWMPVLQDAVALAPKLVEAFANVAREIAGIAGKFKEMNDAIKEITGGGADLVDVLAPEIGLIREALSTTSGRETGGLAGALSGGGLDSLKASVAAGKKGTAADDAIAGRLFSPKQEADGARMAGQALAGLVRNGLAGLETGLMSLGSAPGESGPRNQIGSLERGSQEAFDVLRANTSGGGKDVQKDQLKEQKMTNKNLEKMLKALYNPKLNINQKLEVMGID